ncbi:MAG: glutathione peroxidase [Lysobacteraceae bacterium]|nr:MAG: glutathione peroxidase [Xanthomonadaceae bacterium]
MDPALGRRRVDSMKIWATVALAGLLATAPALADQGLLDHEYRQLAGKQTVNLQDTYGGQVLLVVNTASKCGFTPQYEGLEAMHAKYKDQGFAVLGFPSNDFMGQEPGSEEDIQEFCTLTYGVKFPMFEKVQVRGGTPTPLYADLIKATGEAPGWNFHKYLVDRSGNVIASFGSRTTPDDPKLVAAIEKAIAVPMPAAPVAKK